MDKLVTYRRFISEILTEYAQPSSAVEDLETQFIFDTERDHYQLLISDGIKDGEYLVC
jgi:XisI protein